MKPRGHVIATGGTVSSPTGGSAVRGPGMACAGIPARLGGLAERADVSVQDHNRVLSSQLTVGQLDALAVEVGRVLREVPGLAGVVVLHGTGAMDELLLHRELRHTDARPVVFTGAMIEVSSPAKDGPRNVASAIATSLAPATPDASLDPAVDLVEFAVGTDGTLVRAAAGAGARGLVIEGSGIGNVNEPVANAIRDAIAGGVAVVVASRCPYGRVYPHYGGTTGARALAGLGCVLSGPPGTKTRIALMLALGRSREPAAIQGWFDALLEGEEAEHA